MKPDKQIMEQPSDTRASLELLYRVSREVATTLDLTKVLQRILDLSLETIGATTGSIIIINEQEQPIESAIVVEDRVIHHTIEQLKSTLEEGLAGWVLQKAQPAHIPDTSGDKRWLRRPDDQEHATGAKSAVSVPILARDQKIGVATFVHPEPHHLTKDHLSLVQAIADQAGIAVLNARLYKESAKQARVMTALARSAQAISSTLKLEQVLDNILHQIRKALRVEIVTLALTDSPQDRVEYKAAISNDRLASERIQGFSLSYGEGIAGWVAEHGQGMVINQAQTDPRYQASLCPYQEFIPQAIAAAPIILHDQVIGVLEAINPEKEGFQSDDLLVLSGIGSLAGSSIENAQLFEDLQSTHQRYHDLFENSPDPILITDLEGKILKTNQRTLKVTGFSQDELEGKSIEDIHDLDWTEVEDHFSLFDDHTQSYESALKTQGKGTIPVRVITHRIEIADQPRLEWTMRDITERKELDQLRDDMLSMIYHDLRSPLSNVISSLDVIEASLDIAEGSDIRDLLDIAIRSTKRIQRLTQSLLDINRLESGQSIIKQVRVDPETLITKAHQALITQIQSKDLEVKTNIPDDIPPLAADPDMLERVLINLLQNAVKFSPPQGKIILGVKVEGEQEHFWVQDSGPGVDPEFQDLIFDKFKRIPSHQDIKGLGLGLAFCRLSVEGHGGKIWVENAPEGGSIFSFTIPIGKQQT